jgi:hypothetical protein
MQLLLLFLPSEFECFFRYNHSPPTSLVPGKHTAASAGYMFSWNQAYGRRVVYSESFIGTDAATLAVRTWDR